MFLQGFYEGYLFVLLWGSIFISSCIQLDSIISDTILSLKALFFKPVPSHYLYIYFLVYPFYSFCFTLVSLLEFFATYY